MNRSVEPSLVPKNVVVVGACGFLGQHISRALHQNGHKVIALDSSHPRKRMPFQTVQLNIRGGYELVPHLAEADAVVFLAARSLPATSNDDLSAEVADHVGLTIGAAEQCARSSVAQFIFASSGGTVYGNQAPTPIHEDVAKRPVSAYGVSKLAIENYLRMLSMTSPMACLSLRIANPYGPGQKTGTGQGLVAAAMHAAKTGAELMIWGDGSAVRDYVYVGDVADAFSRALGYVGTRTEMNIGSARGLTVIDLIRSVEQGVDRKIRLRYEKGRSTDVANSVLDIQRAKEELGWVPVTSIESGIRLTNSASGFERQAL